MRSIQFRHLALVFVLMGVISTSLLINISGKKTGLRGRAQSANLQLQCSPSGKVQFAISFTNPEAYPIDLLVDVLLQTQTINRSYTNLTPKKTQTDVISTPITSLSNTGDVIFRWYQSGTMSENANETTASFDAITCTPTTQSPSPTSKLSDEGTTDSSILALTPLPPQPETKPELFYMAFLTEIKTRIQTLLYNFIRFTSAFRN